MTVETSDIQITTLGEEPGAKSLKVEIAAERVKALEQSATSYYAKRARLPGFRKGKAPLSVVRKQYRDAIRERVIRDLIGDGWKVAVERESLKPIADPRVRSLSYEDGEPVTFEVSVEVKPELDLARLGNFRVTRNVAPVTDEAVTAQLDELRQQKATWVPIEGERPAATQMASVSIATIEDDTPSESRQYQVVLGAGQAIPDLEEAIMTLLPGDTTDATVRYPDDFPDESKRGQSRHVRITLHDVKRQELPELDDALAHELGDFDSVADLRKAVRDDLENHATREADAEVRQRLVDEIVTANGVEAPRPLVQRVLSAYAETYGVPDDQLERFTSEFRPIAERQVLRDLIIDHVAERGQLAATEDDVDQRVQELAVHRKMEPGKLYASLQKANQLREIERGITEEKVFQSLLEQSDIVNE
jgi:trigger factor